MRPVFKLQIVFPDGEPLTFEGASAFERNLVLACQQAVVTAAVPLCVEAVMDRGVGLFRSAKHVRADVQAGLQEALGPAVHQAIEAMLYDLKAQTVTKA